MIDEIGKVGVVGTGAMGRGIAQIAAQAGLDVFLFDTMPGTAAKARDAIASTLHGLEQKGRLPAGAAEAAAARLRPCASLGELATCDLVVEAIVEQLDAKRSLFRELEDIVGEQAILATNTSSLSVTALAAACRKPERVAGWHFFNPVPLMKVVEVIDGVRTDAAVCERLTALSRRVGHTPVRARDTPGFIVNHAGRGFGTEALRIVGESVCDVVDVDRLMREQVNLDGKGFRLGPFELMDLTGLDVSHPVMESIYRQFYDEPRFRPSPIAAQRVAGGLYGRKSDRGFYAYADGKAVQADEAAAPVAAIPPVWISRADREGHDAAASLLATLGANLESGDAPSSRALILVTPLGLDATTAATGQGLDASRTVALDTLFPLGGAKRRAIMTTPATVQGARDAAHALLASDGARVTVLRDSPGFVAQRIVAMIVAIACEIAQQRIASPGDIDLAVSLGLGYPLGPLAMGDRLGAKKITAILENMHAVTGDPRYRPSPWLRRRAQLGLSLLHME